MLGLLYQLNPAKLLGIMIDHSWETDKIQLEDLPLFNVDYMVNILLSPEGRLALRLPNSDTTVPGQLHWSIYMGMLPHIFLDFFSTFTHFDGYFKCLSGCTQPKRIKSHHWVNSSCKCSHGKYTYPMPASYCLANWHYGLQ